MSLSLKYNKNVFINKMQLNYRNTKIMIQLTSKNKIEYDIIGLLFPLISLIKEREGWDRIAQYFLCQVNQEQVVQQI